MSHSHEISYAIDQLEANLTHTARVEEWAELMGYHCPKKFARMFLRHYSVRPIKVLEYIRLKSIINQLREGVQSNFEIARKHGIPDEIALNKFVNYHLGCSPSSVKRMDEDQLKIKFGEINHALQHRKIR
jgi:transcriptional regulator GlxA family with amidase domain